MKYRQIALIIILSFLLLTACQTTSPPPPETTEPPRVESNPTGPSGYPVEGYPAGFTPTPFDYTSEEGYLAPGFTPPFTNLPDALNIPTPGPESGVVTGQLLSPGPGGEPYYSTLYLARAIDNDQGEDFPPLIAFSDSDAQLGEQDKTGHFLFKDVPPGKYALALWSPVVPVIVTEPDSESYLVFEVVEGETTDLGIIGIP